MSFRTIPELIRLERAIGITKLKMDAIRTGYNLPIIKHGKKIDDFWARILGKNDGYFVLEEKLNTLQTRLAEITQEKTPGLKPGDDGPSFK